MKSLIVRCIACMVISGALVCFAAGDAVSLALDFEKEAAGSLPEGWKAETAYPDVPNTPVATWKVVEDAKAPSGKHILSLTDINHSATRAYNLLWTNQVRAKDVTVKVAIRSDKGFEDQGGGPMWRVQDASNYYVCRYNPLESNCRLYYVKDGKRTKIGDAIGIVIPAGEWITLEVTHIGDNIVCTLNGKEILNVTDTTIANAGGVGLWTKGDAATSFDSFEVKGI
ncbi:MAG: DUF1080 domain-containing protein [Candidatus Hydrogenedentes bacterium]|nr:DUF1080 domain-containing protein [Candidatus Hydrogenedentota bacterium]